MSQPWAAGRVGRREENATNAEKAPLVRSFFCVRTCASGKGAQGRIYSAGSDLLNWCSGKQWRRVRSHAVSEMGLNLRGKDGVMAATWQGCTDSSMASTQRVPSGFPGHGVREP